MEPRYKDEIQKENGQNADLNKDISNNQSNQDQKSTPIMQIEDIEQTDPLSYSHPDFIIPGC